MSGSPEGQRPSRDVAPADAADAARRRLRDRVFGEVLPDTTSDEREGSERAGSGDSADDEWLRSNVPPHHS